MRIGISRPAWEDGDNEQIFRLAHEMGFHGVQVKPHQYNPLNVDPDRFRETYGELSYLAVGGIIVYPGGDYKRWVDKLPMYIDFVKGIGGEQICICADVQRKNLDEGGIRDVAMVANELGRRAKESGAVISLHNHTNSILESVEDIEKLFAHIDPTYCGLTIDTAHAAKCGIEDLAGALERYRTFVNNVHLKDLAPDGKFCALGTGTLELQSVIRKLQEWNYQEWLIVDEETEGMSVPKAFETSVLYLQSNGLLL